MKARLLILSAMVAGSTFACGSDDDDSGGKGGTGGAVGGSGGATGGSGGSTGGSGGATGGSGGSTGGAAGSTGGAAGGGGTAGSSGGAAGSGGVAGGSSFNEFSGAVPLSADLQDRLFGVTFDAQNKIVGVGFSNVSSANNDAQLAVARFDPTGAPDMTFDSDGIATLNLKVSTNVEAARGVAVQSDGKIVVCGNVEHDPAAAFVDADGVAVRFNGDGSVDMSYGTNGVAIVDLGAGAMVGTSAVSDQIWACDLDSQGRLVLFGSKKNSDPARTDRDRVIARLTTNGELDSTFATSGVYSLDVDGLMQGDTGRHGQVQSDGKIISFGYTTLNGQNEIVVIRLNENGTPDTSFSSDGAVRYNPLAPGMAEAYAGVTQSDGKIVTTGYGRIATSGQVDLVSFRFTAAGVPDPTWGTNGGFIHDLAGDNDRGRNAVVLPDNRVVMMGSGVPTVPALDAMIVVTTPAGALDTSFDGDGYKLYDFGTADEAFFGAAVNATGNLTAAVGYKVPGSAQDDDAVLLILPL